MSTADASDEESSWALFLSLFCVSSGAKTDRKRFSDTTSADSFSSPEPDGILLYEGMLMDNGKEVIYENIICEKPELHPRPTTSPEKGFSHRTTTETGSIGGTKLVKSLSSASNAKRLRKSIISPPTDFRHVDVGTPYALPIPQLPDIPTAVLRESWAPSLERSLSCPQNRASRRLSYMPGPNQPQIPPMPYYQEMRRRSKSVSAATAKSIGQLDKEPGTDSICAPETRKMARSVCVATPRRAPGQLEGELAQEPAQCPVRSQRPRSVSASTPYNIATDQSKDLTGDFTQKPEGRRVRSVSASAPPRALEKQERLAKRAPLPPRLPLKPAIVHRRWTSSPSLKDSNRSSPEAHTLEHQRSFSSQSFHFPRKPVPGPSGDSAAHNEEAARNAQPSRPIRTRSCTTADMEAFQKKIGVTLQDAGGVAKRQGIYCMDEPSTRSHRTNNTPKLEKMPPIPGSPHSAALLNSFLAQPQPEPKQPRSRPRPRPQTMLVSTRTWRDDKVNISDKQPSQPARPSIPDLQPTLDIERKRQSICYMSYWHGGIAYPIDLDTSFPRPPTSRRSYYCAPRNLTARGNRMSSPIGSIGIAV